MTDISLTPPEFRYVCFSMAMAGKGRIAVRTTVILFHDSMSPAIPHQQAPCMHILARGHPHQSHQHDQSKASDSEITKRFSLPSWFYARPCVASVLYLHDRYPFRCSAVEAGRSQTVHDRAPPRSSVAHCGIETRSVTPARSRAGNPTLPR
jgi:hypothetical protein